MYMKCSKLELPVHWSRTSQFMGHSLHKYPTTKVAISMQHSLWEANIHSTGQETSHSMETTCSLPCLQGPVTGSQPEPNETSTYNFTLLSWPF